jgi:hypothetical protein
MTQVEVVALWAGLIASIAGIVLSVAALVFGVWVNNRATQVNDQTIKSLQKIESTVERLSEDTRNLIKAGWDKMLGGFGDSAASTKDDEDEERSDREIASGLTDEAKVELGIIDGHKSSQSRSTKEELQQIDQVLNRLQETLQAQLKNASLRGKSGRGTDLMMGRISDVSPKAQALLKSIAAPSWHLTREQYTRLRRSPISAALLELRKAGLLVPLSGNDDDGEKIPVYWLPPGSSRRIKAALELVGEPPADVQETVNKELRNIEYPPHRP